MVCMSHKMIRQMLGKLTISLYDIATDNMHIIQIFATGIKLTSKERYRIHKFLWNKKKHNFQKIHLCSYIYSKHYCSCVCDQTTQELSSRTNKKGNFMSHLMLSHMHVAWTAIRFSGVFQSLNYSSHVKRGTLNLFFIFSVSFVGLV